MPGRGHLPEIVFSTAQAIAGTAGQAYADRRGIPSDIAHAAEVRFDPDFAGRPAVLVALRDQAGTITSVHGRYLHAGRGQSKMLTVGRGEGAISFLGGWQVEPFILVEGLFDGLSLAVCGWPSVATIGRKVSWIEEVAAGRVVWAAFDAGKSGDDNYQQYLAQLSNATVRRLYPPPRCKDWNTAIVKRGPVHVSRWVRDQIMVTE